MMLLTVTIRFLSTVDTLDGGGDFMEGETSTIDIIDNDCDSIVGVRRA